MHSSTLIYPWALGTFCLSYLPEKYFRKIFLRWDKIFFDPLFHLRCHRIVRIHNLLNRIRCIECTVLQYTLWHRSSGPAEFHSRSLWWKLLWENEFISTEQLISKCRIHYTKTKPQKNKYKTITNIHNHTKPITLLRLGFWFWKGFFVKTATVSNFYK